MLNDKNVTTTVGHLIDGKIVADTERTQIVQEQTRLRDNLARVPANSDLQRRYLATLDKQETDLEAIAKRRADAEKGVEAARETLRTYVAQLG